MSVQSNLIDLYRKLAFEIELPEFSAPVAFTYNPLIYAQIPLENYIKRYGSSKKRVLFFGMNPGPWGMGQTGVPFGDIASVRNWLGINGPVGKPAYEHPKRVVDGFDCTRGEVSGSRLWGLMKERFSSPESFFQDQFVTNYCPLLFFDAGVKNVTPDRLSPGDRHGVVEICDKYAARCIEILEPSWVIGIGKYVERRLYEVASSIPFQVNILGILHPSPASPLANRGWSQAVVEKLKQNGVW